MTWVQLGLDVATAAIIAYMLYCVLDTHWRIARVERILMNSERGVGMLLSVLVGLEKRAKQLEQEQEEKDQ